MKRIKPKWLLGATLAVALVMTCSVVTHAAAPSFTGGGITSPTNASPEYRQPGATFTVTFGYASDPDTIPRWTKALVQLLDGATLVKEIEETILSARDDSGSPTGYPGTASIGMIIPPPPLPGLTEGLYDVKVFLSNSDGGGWSVSDTELDAIIIDQTGPGAPGTPSTTTPTTDTTPDWTWTAATDPTILGGATPGSGIKGYWVKIGTTSGEDEVLTDTWVGNVLAWTTVPALPADDTYYLSVRAEDNVGNLGAWATGSVLVDTTNPNNPSGLTVTTPTNDTTPLVTWTAATDPGYPDSGSGVVNYQVQIGTSTGAGDVKVWTSVGNITTFDDAAWTALGVTLVPDDSYFFQVRSEDAVGYTSAGVEVQIDVDATVPTDPGSLDSDEDPTADTTIEWSWTASTDPDPGAGLYFSGLAGYYVKLGTTSGGDDVVAETSVGDVLAYITPDLTLNGTGTYYLSVRAKDVAGNYSGWVTHSVLLDITAPGAPGIPGGTSPTTDTTPTWSWTAGADWGSGVASYNVKIGTTQGGSDILGVTNTGSSSYTPLAALAPDDRYYLSAQTVDYVGNVSTWSEDPSGILVDTTAPLAPTGLTAATPTNDSTPEVTWTAATDPGYPDSGSGIAGYNVKIGTTSGGSEVKAATAVGNITTFDDAAWAALLVTLAPDGTYYFQVQSIDNVAWTSGWTEVSIVVETTRPTLANGSPTGYIPTDVPTISADFADAGLGLDASETTLTLTYAGSPTVITAGFTGVPGYADGLLATNIRFTPVPPGLEDGAWTADMVAYDLAGNKTLPDPTLQWTFNIDTTPPTDPGSPVAGNVRDDGNWYINTLRPTFSWTASEDPDAPDGTPGSGLRDYSFQFGTDATKPGSGVDPWGGALVDVTGIPPTPLAGVQQWTPTADLPLAAGTSYSGRVKAFDNLGNATLWIDPPIIYDPDPPTVPGTPTTTSPTNDATPSWTWTGSTDDISGVDLYHIQIRRAGGPDWDVLDTELDIPDAPTPGGETWAQGLELESGTYEIRVRAMDVAGNYSDWCEPATVTVDVDKPTAPVMAAEPEFTQGTSNTVSWSASSDSGAGGLAGYEIRTATTQDGLAIATPISEAGTSREFTSLADGQIYYYQVHAVDGVGNVSDWSNIVSSTQDASAPTAPGTPSTTSPTADTTPRWTWAPATDATSGVADYDVYFWQVDVLVPPFEGWIGNTTTWTVPAGIATVDGQYGIKVKAKDALDQESGWSVINYVTIDTTGPVVTPAVPPTSPTNDPRPTWTWVGVDVPSGVKGFWVALDSEPAAWTTNPSFTPSSDLADGVHVLKVQGEDGLGNLGSEVTLSAVTIDTTPPAVPGMPWTTSPTSNTTPHWYWDQVAGATRYNVYLDDVIMVTVLQPAPGVLVDWVTSPALSEGEHYLQVSSLDALGNESGLSEAGYVTIDTTGPAAPVVTLMTPSPTNEVPQVWHWSGPADAVGYEIAWTTTETEPAAGTDVLAEHTATSDYDESGTYYLYVRAYDWPGNRGAWGHASVIIDADAPGVTFINPTDGGTFDITTSSTIIAEITGDFDPHQVWVSIDGGGEVTPTAIVGSTVYHVVGVPFRASEDEEDTHTVTIRVKDSLGNEGSASVDFIVENYRQGFGFGRLRFDNTEDGD